MCTLYKILCRLSLLSNLRKLSKDDALKYDLRDATSGQYLYGKSKQFGISSTNITKMLTENSEWLVTMEEINNPLNGFLSDQTGIIPDSSQYQIETKFDDDSDCMTFKINLLNILLAASVYKACGETR